MISVETIEIRCFLEIMLFHRSYGILVISMKSIEICVLLVLYARDWKSTLICMF